MPQTKSSANWNSVHGAHQDLPKKKKKPQEKKKKGKKEKKKFKDKTMSSNQRWYSQIKECSYQEKKT